MPEPEFAKSIVGPGFICPVVPWGIISGSLQWNVKEEKKKKTIPVRWSLHQATKMKKFRQFLPGKREKQKETKQNKKIKIKNKKINK